MLDDKHKQPNNTLQGFRDEGSKLESILHINLHPEFEFSSQTECRIVILIEGSTNMEKD